MLVLTLSARYTVIKLKEREVMSQQLTNTLFKKVSAKKGFALPTVLIASLVFLILGASAMQAVSSGTRSINDQYWNSLAQEAKESGMKYIEDCLKNSPTTSDPTAVWTAPITQSTDCSGSAQDGLPTEIANVAASGNAPKWRSSFTASPPQLDTTTGRKISKIVGTIQILSASNTVVRTYSSSSSIIINVSGSTEIPPATAKKVVTTPKNTCVLAEEAGGNSSVYCSGDNVYGQLGIGTKSSSPVSTPIRFSIPSAYEALDVVMYASVTGDFNQTCVSGNDGTNTKVWCAGYDNGGFGVSSTAPAGRENPVVWGGGSGTNILGAPSINGDSNFTTICVPEAQFGSVQCSGEGTVRQLGNTGGGPGNASDMAWPVTFYDNASPALKLSGYNDTFSPARQVCVLRENGQVFCAGNAPSGQFGDGSPSRVSTGWGPRRLFGSATPLILTDIAQGRGAVCAQTDNSLLYCTGELPTGAQQYNAATVFESTSTFIRDFTVGYNTICAITTDYTPKCISGNENCVLGNNAATCTSSPATNIASPLTLTYTPPTGADYKVTRVLGAEKKLCLYYVVTGAESTTGAMSCAGDNTYGQLGNGTASATVKQFNTYFTLPSGLRIKYPGVTRGQALPDQPNVYRNMELPGTEHTCVIATDNQVYCAGRNQRGQLGVGNTTDSSTPVQFQLP